MFILVSAGLTLARLYFAISSWSGNHKAHLSAKA